MKTQNAHSCHPRALLRHPRAGGDLVVLGSEQFSWDSRLRGNDGRNSPSVQKGWRLRPVCGTESRGSLTRKIAWFTLVELIVVITILVILGTIAFVSLGGFSESARDGVRTTNASALMKGLDVSYIRTGSYPLPDTSSINILSGSTLIGYQGYVGSGIILRSKVSGDLSDPVDKIPFTYNVNVTQKKAQILGFFESSTSIALQTPSPIAEQVIAATPDYSKRYPFVKGQSLGIILSATGSTKNLPAQEFLTGSVDVGSGTVTATLSAYIGVQSGSVSGTGVSTVAPLYLAVPITFPLTLSLSSTHLAYSSTPTDITSTALSSFISTPFVAPTDYASVGADDTNYKTTSITGGAGSATGVIDFNTSGNYTVQDSSKAEVIGGIVDLIGGTGAFTFTKKADLPAWANTTCITQMWGGGGLVSFNGRIWILGSCPGNAVWSSPDGITWTQLLTNTASPGPNQFTQVYGSYFVWNGKMWKVDTNGSNAVWNSTDGVTWTKLRANGDPNGYTIHGNTNAIVYNNKIWVIAGNNTTNTHNYNDVWSSPDGVAWTLVLADTASPGPNQFSQRQSYGLLVYNNKLWVVSDAVGWPTTNDAWSTTDGVAWTQVRATNSANGFRPFSAGSMVVYQNAMWVFDGFRNYPSIADYSSIWSSTDGAVWTQNTAAAPYTARENYGTTVFKNAVWVIGWYNRPASSWTPDVWATQSVYPTSSVQTVVTSSDQLNTASWWGITGAAVNEFKPTNTSIYYATSFDNRNSFAINMTGAWRSIAWNDSGTWRYNSNTTYGSTTWTACATNTQEACLSQAFGVTQNQMTGTQMQNIASGNWSTAGGFTPGSTSTLDLAVGLSTTDSSVTPSVDNVAFTYGTAPRYASQLYTFNTSAYSVTSLTPSLTAFATANVGNGIIAKIWNASTNSWYTLSSLGNTVGAMPGTAASQTLNFSVSNYIDGSGIVRILVSSLNPSTAGVAASLSTDFMQLTVDGTVK